RRLHEVVRIEAAELRRPRAQRQQPVRQRLGRVDVRIVEVVAPAERGREPPAGPLMELERRQRRPVGGGDERLLLGRRDNGIGLAKAGEARRYEQIGLVGEHARWDSMDDLWQSYGEQGE